MYCSNCGTRIQDGAKFCHNCGAQVVSNASSADEHITAAASAAPVTEPSFGGQIPEPSFAAPQYTPAEPEIHQAPVMDVPQGTYTTSSPYTGASPFAGDAPAAADAPKEIGGEVPSYNYTYSAADTAYRSAADSSASPYTGGSTYMTPAATAPAQNGTDSSSPYSGGNVYSMPEGVNAVPVKAGKKGTRKYLLSIIITFLILGLCWWYFFGRGNSGVKPDDTDPAPAVNVDPTADEDYIRAKQALEDGDSETAFDILSGLLDKYPNNSEVFALFWEACKQNMLSSISEKDYGAAELYVNLLATLDPDNADELYRNFYNVWLSDLAQGNADGDMREVLEKADPYIDDELKAIIQSILDGPKVSAEAIAVQIADNLDQNKKDTAAFVLTACSDYIDQLMEASGYNPIFVTLVRHEYTKVIIYPSQHGGYAAYYGDLDEHAHRSGGGTMVSSGDVDDETFFTYWYTAPWVNDLPNGTFTEVYSVYTKEGTNVQSREVYTGTLADGLYDGDLIETVDGFDYHCVMSNGKHTQEYGRNDEGMVAFAYCIGDSTKLLYMNEEDFKGIYGVYLYD